MYQATKRFALGGAVMLASVLAVAVPSLAANVQTNQNVATGFCLDSNADRQVYTHDCNSGSYQKWEVTRVGKANILKNVATGFCLDSNAARQVYTHDCNSGSYQKWEVGRIGNARVLKNVATGFYLDSNADRQVYTHGYNGGSYQKWR